MSRITLSDFNEAVENDYKDFTIDLEDGTLLSFRPILRLSKEKRSEIDALREGKDLSKIDDIVELTQGMFKIRAAKAADYNKLKQVIGNEPARWIKLFELAMADENVGEA